MSMTQARLKKLCGGLPKYTLACHERGCTRVVGPYYYHGNAVQALIFHLSAIHGYTREETREDEPKKPTTIPRTIPVKQPKGSTRRHKKF